MTSSLSILHRDESLAVVSKPAGVLSVASSDADAIAVPEILARDGMRAIPVHRLDRDVSGVMVVALDEITRQRLEDLFRAREVEKVYWALAQGDVRPAAGALRFPILAEGGFARVSARGQAAETRYRTLQHLPTTTELEVQLMTGRYNQIRVHFAHAGFPLVGERKYARGKDSPIRAKSRRIALHAWRLAFVHPSTQRRIEVEAPLPDDLLALLARASQA